MYSPRDGSACRIWDVPAGDVERMLSLFRKLKTREAADGAGVWQSMNAGERDLALCAVTAAWQEISRYLPGYFDPRKELDKARTLEVPVQTSEVPAQVPAWK